MWIIILVRRAIKIKIVDVFFKQIRSILEFGVPVWNCGLTKEESIEIERVQKTFLHIVLGNKYLNYNKHDTVAGGSVRTNCFSGHT